MLGLGKSGSNKQHLVFHSMSMPIKVESAKETFSFLKLSRLSMKKMLDSGICKYISDLSEGANKSWESAVESSGLKEKKNKNFRRLSLFKEFVFLFLKLVSVVFKFKFLTFGVYVTGW